MPRDTEQDSAIRSFGDHQRRRAGKEFFRKHQVGTLADSQHFAAGGFVHFSQSINEHPCRIDDHAGRSFEFDTILSVPENRAGYFVVLFRESDNLHIICDDSA